MPLDTATLSAQVDAQVAAGLPGGGLKLSFARSTGVHDVRAGTRSTSTRVWTGRGFFGKQSVAALLALAGTDVATATKRPLLVTGASLVPPTPPLPGDVVLILGQRYTLTAVTPVGAPSGGVAPLYRCEVS